MQIYVFINSNTMLMDLMSYVIVRHIQIGSLSSDVVYRIPTVSDMVDRNTDM